MKRHLYILSAVLAIVSCGKENGGGEQSGSEDVKTEQVRLTPDRTSIIKNPLTGWVLYVGRQWNDTFWSSQNYDAMPTSDGTTVKVSDYATCAYLRTSWKNLEPTEGNYVWKDPASNFSKLVASLRARGLKMSFRVVVDGRDQGLNTPEYVFNAGCAYYTDGTHTTWKSPYPDDPVFQEKYAKFIRAFGEEFNDPDKTEFVDGYGLGLWGEGHTLIYKDNSNKAAVFDWITDLYLEAFSRIPLVMNYHNTIGDPVNDNKLKADTETLLDRCVEKGYSLRNDAFGMHTYYTKWHQGYAAKWFYKRPIVMEGGFVLNTHRYWIYPEDGYREGHPEDVRRGEYEQSGESHVNMMDFRTNGEIQSWFKDAFDLVKKFNQEGGYRLYPDQITVPVEASHGADVSISHRWVNLGWGYCPVNIPQWNQKYKVAFALLDRTTEEPVKVFVCEDTDLSQWLQAKPTSYKSSIRLSGFPAGRYTWAVGLVDRTRDNAIGLNMSVKESFLTKDGWARIADVTIK